MTELPAHPAANADTTVSDKITIRPATTDDESWIDALQALAFGPGRFSRAAFRVRELIPVDPDFSLITVMDERPVSSVMMTPIRLSGHAGYLLGPLATDPAYRGRGAAKALVRKVCAMALERDPDTYVLLVGDPPYYGPLGFNPVTPGAIVFPRPVDPNRVLVYSQDATLAERLRGEVAP